MVKRRFVPAVVLVVGTVCSPAFSGSCQEKDGMLLCTDDVGRDSTLKSLDKALGSAAPFDPPTSHPDALKTFPSDITPREERRKKEDSQKLSIERPGLDKDSKK